MGEREALQLIFAAGFSTAAQVTNVSGRGVGMDVVRTNIERIGGTVDVHTELGVGTTFKVKIPLTLAIIPALVVSSGGDRYAIPQLSLLELVRLEGEQARSGIELVHGAPVYRLRGRLLPIVEPERGARTRAVAGREREVINIVVLQADGHQFGLIVDEITDTQEIVVKPLGTHLKDATLFAGATIMGDGRVALILDVLGIAQRARVVSEARERAGGSRTRTRPRPPSTRGGPCCWSSAWARTGGRDRAVRGRAARGVPGRRDRVGRQPRGRPVPREILPLVRLGDALGLGGWTEAPGPDATLDVVVHTAGGHEVGLVVGASSTSSSRRSTSTAGTAGPASSDPRSSRAGSPTWSTPTPWSAGPSRPPSPPPPSEPDHGHQRVLHLQPGRSDLRRRGPGGPGGHPAPAADRCPPRTPRRRGADQPAWPDRDRARPAPSARAGARPEGQAAMNVVVRTSEGELSLLVDEIGDVEHVDDDAFETPPDTLDGVARELITGAYKLEDRLLLVLDIDKVVQFQAA
jgi:chemotaxis signal transduction protein